MITEYLMKPGQWELSLKPNTPLAVRKAIPYCGTGLQPFGTICVTLNRLPFDQSITRTVVLANSIYSGIIRRRSNQMHTFGGPSILAWLGDENGKGYPSWGSLNGVIGVSWQTAVHAEFTNSYMLPGATEGSYYSTNSTNINAPTHTRSTPFRQFFDPLAVEVGVEYRFTPAGVLNSSGIGVAGVFAQTPTMCLLREGGGRDPSLVGINAWELDVEGDFDSFADTVYVYQQPSGTLSGTSAASPVAYVFNGVGPREWMDLYTDLSTTSATDAQNYSDKLRTQVAVEHRQIKASVQEFGFPRFAIPGDYIYVFDRETDLVDSSNPIDFRGRTIYPVKVRLMGYTWPVEAGMGVYTIANNDGTNTVTDITDWVQWETGTTSLEVGALERPLAAAMQAGDALS